MQPHRANNFNALRLLLALAVILSHTPELIDGNRNREIFSRLFGTYSLGEVAVNAFFILSGFLITASWVREPALISFARKRLLRIAPGFFVAVAICLIFFTPLGGASAWSQIDITKVAKRLLLMIFDAPGFLSNPNPLLNGSRWTIHYEVFCYALLAFIGSSRVIKNKHLILTLLITFLSLYLLHKYFSATIFPSLSDVKASLWNRVGYYLRFSSYFLCGTALYLFQDKIVPSINLVIACAASFILLMTNVYTATLANALPMTILLYVVGSSTSPIAQRMGSTDLSYGTYLYAWPIQQAIIFYISKNIAVVFFLSSTGCLFFAWLSWKFVEQPSLNFKYSSLNHGSSGR